MADPICCECNSDSTDHEPGGCIHGAIYLVLRGDVYLNVCGNCILSSDRKHLNISPPAILTTRVRKDIADLLKPYLEVYKRQAARRIGCGLTPDVLEYSEKAVEEFTRLIEDLES